MVPLTVSLATIFTPDSFAKICKMVRTSTSWKSKEILRPLNDLFAFWFKPPDSVLAAFRRYFKYKTAGRGFGIDVPIRIIVADNELGRVADAFERNVLYRRIKVSHIQTALRLCRQRMVFQGHNHAVALLFNVRLSAETWGGQFNNAGIACAFAEIDIGC